MKPPLQISLNEVLSQNYILVVINLYFGGYKLLDLAFFRRSEKKKLKKILCLKCVSGPIEPKKFFSPKPKIFFPLGGWT